MRAGDGAEQGSGPSVGMSSMGSCLTRPILSLLQLSGSPRCVNPPMHEAVRGEEWRGHSAAFPLGYGIVRVTLAWMHSACLNWLSVRDNAIRASKDANLG